MTPDNRPQRDDRLLLTREEFLCEAAARMRLSQEIAESFHGMDVTASNLARLNSALRPLGTRVRIAAPDFPADLELIWDL